MTSTIQGTVEYVIHRNPANGYSVVEISDEEGLLTIVGTLPELTPGELIEVEGSFVTHPTYGEQLVVEHFAFCRPEGVRAVERYLASGIIKGVGPQLAMRIVSKFQEDTLAVMENAPDQLATVSGISAKGARKIQAQMLEKKEMRDALLYMDGYGIPLPLATRIFERYGAALYTVLTQNPYQLIDDLTHVGFRIADEIARRTGLAEDSAFRITSGLHYAMMQALEAGHIFLPFGSLLAYACELLDLPEEILAEGIENLAFDKRFVIREVAGVRVVYLATYYYMEMETAVRLKELGREIPLSEELVDREIGRIQADSELQLDEQQLLAFRLAVTCGLSVITGGPGTGKTTVISAILRFFEKQDMTVELAAPTGRAAKRITEATGRPAKTIHRLLEYMGKPENAADPDGPLRFTRNEANPLEADAVIVDEVSMVDLPLMYSLLKAILPGTRVVLVGDADQLPSVGPGNVLKDIIRSGVIRTTALSRIYRQEAGSDIVVNAHRINQGEYIDPSVKSNDFVFLRRSAAEAVQDAVIRLVSRSLPEYVGADPSEIQVISPTRKGPLGVEALNRILQNALNPPAEGKKERNFPKGTFRVGDKLMQIKNNYQKEWISDDGFTRRSGTGVFNGDIGTLQEIRFFTEELVVLFDDDRKAVYQFAEAEELELAYAITVHKAQGSEYPAVVLPLLNVPAPLMTRPLIYTAVTRARSCVCLVGSPEVFQRMVDNNTEQRRYSSLHLQLMDTAEKP